MLNQKPGTVVCELLREALCLKFEKKRHIRNLDLKGLALPNEMRVKALASVHIRESQYVHVHFYAACSLPFAAFSNCKQDRVL